MRRPLALLLAALSLALAGCAPAAPGGTSSAPGSLSSPDLSAAQSQSDPEPQPEPVPEPDPRQEAVDRALSGMTLEEKAALCRRISARAQPSADAPPLTDYLRDWDRLPTAVRAAAADCLIETIRATETELRIVWRV